MAEGYVLDASVVINLLGSGVADRILGALEGRRVVPDVTSGEILRHPLRTPGHADPLEPFVRSGLIERIPLMPLATATFLGLVGAGAPDGLGDGEAAAIALAQELELTIALDDTKARRIVRDQFSRLRMQSSVDLFALPAVATVLGDGLADAVFSALVNARMRVTVENEPWVLQLLGDRAVSCPSLKKRRR